MTRGRRPVPGTRYTLIDGEVWRVGEQYYYCTSPHCHCKERQQKHGPYYKAFLRRIGEKRDRLKYFGKNPPTVLLSEEDLITMGIRRREEEEDGWQRPQREPSLERYWLDGILMGINWDDHSSNWVGTWTDENRKLQIRYFGKKDPRSAIPLENRVPRRAKKTTQYIILDGKLAYVYEERTKDKGILYRARYYGDPNRTRSFRLGSEQPPIISHQEALAFLKEHGYPKLPTLKNRKKERKGEC